MLKKFVLSMLVLALFAVAPATSVRVDNPQITPSIEVAGFGRAVIDGVFSPGEWDKAGELAFVVNLPSGMTAPAFAYIMNDLQNLYIAVLIQRPAMDWGSVILEFDNDNCGGFERDEGDDIFQIDVDPNGPIPVTFADFFRTYGHGCPEGQVWALRDDDYEGTIDGIGKAENQVLNGVNYNVYEFSHPLDSGDIGHDFSLKPSDTVGFTIFTQIQNVQTFYPSMFLSNWTFGDIIIMRPALQDLADFIAGLPDEAFVNNPAQRKNALGEKLKAIERMIAAQDYDQAIDKLQNDLRSKADGCFGGEPNNDWIVDCDVQEELLNLMDILIEYLASLL